MDEYFKPKKLKKLNVMDEYSESMHALCRIQMDALAWMHYSEIMHALSMNISNHNHPESKESIAKHYSIGLKV